MALVRPMEIRVRAILMAIPMAAARLAALAAAMGAVPATRTVSYGGGSYGSYGSRPAPVPQSIKKNDKHIVYRNPVKVVKSPAPSGPTIEYDNPYHEGARVRHSRYGTGVIMKAYGSGDNARVDVRFDRENMNRTIILKYAALEVIG